MDSNQIVSASKYIDRALTDLTPEGGGKLYLALIMAKKIATEVEAEVRLQEENDELKDVPCIYTIREWAKIEYKTEFWNRYHATKNFLSADDWDKVRILFERNAWYVMWQAGRELGRRQSSFTDSYTQHTYNHDYEYDYVDWG